MCLCMFLGIHECVCVCVCVYVCVLCVHLGCVLIPRLQLNVCQYILQVSAHIW